MCRAWSRSSCACLTARTVSDLGESADRLRLDVHDDARRDVVDDDRPVAGGRDRFEVGDDTALRRLVVVRRDDEEPVGAELVRLLGAGGRSGRVEYVPGAGDDRTPRSPTASSAARKRSMRSPSASVGLSPVVPATTTPSEPLVDEVAREALERVEVDRPVLAERRHDRGQDVAQHRHGFYVLTGRGTPRPGRHRAGRAIRREASGNSRSSTGKVEVVQLMRRMSRSPTRWNQWLCDGPLGDEESHPALFQPRTLLPGELRRIVRRQHRAGCALERPVVQRRKYPLHDSAAPGQIQVPQGDVDRAEPARREPAITRPPAVGIVGAGSRRPTARCERRGRPHGPADSPL